MNKNFEQTGGKKIRKVKWAPDTKKHQPQFTKRPSSKRVLRKIKAAWYAGTQKKKSDGTWVLCPLQNSA